MIGEVARKSRSPVSLLSWTQLDTLAEGTVVIGPLVESLGLVVVGPEKR